MSVFVRRASGLVEPFEPPDLTVEAAIERSWEPGGHAPLLEPKPEEFLKITPGPRYTMYPLPVSDHLIEGPFVTGLPEV